MSGLASDLLEVFCVYVVILVVCRGVGKLINYHDTKRNIKKED